MTLPLGNLTTGDPDDYRTTYTYDAASPSGKRV
jgi:hypothetical protein